MTEQPIADAHWQLIEQLAETFAERQRQIEADSDKKDQKGLTTELKKVVAYLYAKVQDDTLQPAQIGDDFFQYLNILKIKGKQIARSGKTPDYYKAIDDVCGKHLKKYRDQPVLILQILGWAARLVPYYKDGYQNEENNRMNVGGSNDGDRPKPKPKPKPTSSSTGDSQPKPPGQPSQPVGKTAIELALERAQQKKKR